MKILFCTFVLVTFSALHAGPTLYDRNYYGLDWGRGGAYGEDDDCECRGEPDCECDK